MNVGLSSLYDIGFNYTIKLNDKELLVFEEDESFQEKSPHTKKIQEDEELESDKAQESGFNKELSVGEELMIKELEARDTEVRAHESAHQSAAGGMAGAASFTYQQGPDGKMYAIGGEVPITIQSGSTPQETIANARQAAAAAMAPASPSSQDFAVASSARVMEMKAQQQLAKEQSNKMLGKETYGSIAEQEGVS